MEKPPQQKRFPAAYWVYIKANSVSKQGRVKRTYYPLSFPLKLKQLNSKVYSDLVHIFWEEGRNNFIMVCKT